MIKPIHIKLLLLFSLSILFGRSAFTQNITDPVPAEQHICVGEDVTYTVFGFPASTIQWYVTPDATSTQTYLTGKDVTVLDNGSNFTHTNGLVYNKATYTHQWSEVLYPVGGYLLQMQEVSSDPAACESGIQTPGLKVYIHAKPTINSTTPTHIVCSGDKGSLAVSVTATVPTSLQLQYRLVTSADVEVVAWVNDNLTHNFNNLDAGSYKVQIRYVLDADNSKLVKGSFSESSVVTIVEDDSVNPTASNPSPVTVQCSGDVPAVDITVVTDEADNCTANPVVAHVSDVSDGNTCPEVITRTYSVTDASGNSIDVTQTITVQDTEAPVIAAAPAAITIECIGDLPSETSLSWTDNCDAGGTVTSVTGALVGGTCGGTYTRTWNVDDACGNSAITRTQIITVQDTEAPVIAAAPAAITIECIGDLPSETDLSWTDNCDAGGTVTSVTGALVGGTCGGTYTRTWNVDDACGNSAITRTQIITVNDNTAPIITTEAIDYTVECDGSGNSTELQAWLNTHAGAAASDNCSGVTWSNDFTALSDDCGATGAATVIFTATDDCGNTSTTTATFTIVDNTIPVIAAAPAAITIECIGDLPSETDLSWTDNCDAGGTVTSVTGALVGGTCGGTYTRTWNVDDACGNSAITRTQIITVNDNIAPVFASTPGDLTAECTVPTTYADYAAFVTAGGNVTDNCSVNTGSFTHVGDVSDNNSNPELITRTYRILDNCGNSSEYVQTITINDITAPVISSCPSDITECAANEITQKVEILNIELDPANYSDNCGGVLTVQYQIKKADGTILVDFGDDADGNASGYEFPVGINTVTYRVIDVAGLSSECSFTISVSYKPSPGQIVY